MSKLADIEAAVAALPKLSEHGVGDEYDTTAYLLMERNGNTFSIGWDEDFIEVLDFIRSSPQWLTDLVAVVKAAQAMRAESRNIPQTVMTYHMYDVVAPRLR